MSGVIASVEAHEDGRQVELPADVLDEQLIGQLVDRARAGGLQLTGEGGLLQQLTQRVLESALEGEITDHAGYEKHDPADAGSGNSRNGIRAKTVLTDVGPAEIEVPRDRESVNARIRKAVRARGHFPNEAAALKCVYMAVINLDPTGQGRKRWTMRWKPALQAFDIAFDGRLSIGSR